MGARRRKSDVLCLSVLYFKVTVVVEANSIRQNHKMDQSSSIHSVAPSSSTTLDSFSTTGTATNSSHNTGCSSTDSSSNGKSGITDALAAACMVAARQLDLDEDRNNYPHNRPNNDTLKTKIPRNDTLSSLIPGPTGPVIGESDLFYIPVRATAAMGLPSPPIDFKRQRYESHRRFFSLSTLPPSYFPLFFLIP